LPEAAALSPNELASLNDGDITGSTPAPKKEDRPHGAPKGVTTTPPPETPTIGGAKFVAGGGSQAERALYEKLGERREALDKRQRDLELRENMLKEAELRLQMRLDELKDIENRLNGKGGEQRAKLKNIVSMYESMNPKQAAQIFDKLDQGVLLDVAVAMKTSKLAAVMAAMTPDGAQRLTVELAKRSEGGEQGLPSTDLKKIETKPAS
jgi:flagellar motility protein MotE (MotC chaperone)